MGITRAPIRSLVAVSGLVLLSACAETTRITSEPEGADVYVNEIYVGETPTLYRYRSGTPETAYLKLHKTGYDEVRNATIDKVYRADVYLFWLIPGILPYFVGTARFEDSYLFQLQHK